MSRNRIIKPEFCSSLTLSSISLESNLLFALLWTHCDDFGTILNNNRQILGNCFPHRPEITEKHIDKWKSELVNQKLICPVIYNNKEILIMRSWEEHQKVPNISKRNNIDNDMEIPEIKAKIRELIKHYLESNFGLIRDKLESNSPMNNNNVNDNEKENVNNNKPAKQVLPTAAELQELYISKAKELFNSKRIFLNLVKCTEKAQDFVEYWLGDEEYPGEWLTNKKFKKQRINVEKTILNNLNYKNKEGVMFNFEYMANYDRPFIEPENSKLKELKAKIFKNNSEGQKKIDDLIGDFGSV